MADAPLVLIVDDSPIQCKIYAKVLKNMGCQVILGENGRQGVELALQHHPALILMDISMPEMDGLSAVRELRTHAEMVHLPILALTASTEPDELEQAYQAGYNDILNKSSDQGAAVAKIQQWLLVGG